MTSTKSPSTQPRGDRDPYGRKIPRPVLAVAAGVTAIAAVAAVSRAAIPAAHSLAESNTDRTTNAPSAELITLTPEAAIFGPNTKLYKTPNQSDSLDPASNPDGNIVTKVPNGYNAIATNVADYALPSGKDKGNWYVVSVPSNDNQSMEWAYVSKDQASKAGSPVRTVEPAVNNPTLDYTFQTIQNNAIQIGAEGHGGPGSVATIVPQEKAALLLTAEGWPTK